MKIGVFEHNWGKLIGGSHMYIGVTAESLSLGHDVTIVHQYDRLSNEYMSDFLDIDLSRVRFRKIDLIEGGSRPARTRNPIARLRSTVDERAELSKDFDLFFGNFGFHLPPFNHSPRGVLQVDFPFKDYEWWHHFGQQRSPWTSPMGMAKRLYNWHVWRERFASYHRILANSEFTRDWLKRRWFVDSTVVYPPSRDGITPQSKQSTILGVSRFVPDKRADILVEAFRMLCDRGLEGWQLVLAGGLDLQWEGAVPYIDKLKRRAEGYPIELRMDTPSPELRRLFQDSAIFWHAKGYGIDPEINPEHMEHFGIVVVEAMAAGCVPFVFAGGGQREIVRHGVDGSHWHDPAELADRTWDLINTPDGFSRMSASSVRRAASFNKQSFAKNLREALGDLLPPSNARPRTAESTTTDKLFTKS